MADFIGKSNFFDGETFTTDGGGRLQVARKSATSRGDAVLAVRP